MAGISSELTDTQTPSKSTLKVPLGHIILTSKWRNTDLSTAIQSSVNTLFEDSLGYIDFHPASHMGVVYAAEADLVAQGAVRRKLAKLRKVNRVQVIVIAERTMSSNQYYQSLQKYVMLELGFHIIPVPTQTEAAGVLVHMVLAESKLESNPFLKKRKPGNLDESLLTTLQCVPRLGAVKARKLLEHFHSLQAINAASLADLSAVVGRASAQTIRTFLDPSST